MGKKKYTYPYDPVKAKQYYLNSRERSRKYAIEYSKKHKKERIAQHKKWVKNNRLATNIDNLACIICAKKTDLIFHHKNPKDKEFSVGRHSVSVKRLLVEIKKCIIVCRGCHSSIHRFAEHRGCSLLKSIQITAEAKKAKGGKVKEAIVYKDRTGYWAVEDWSSNKKIGGFHDSELAAYKLANYNGYVVR